MNDPNDITTNAGDPSAPTRQTALRSRFERLRALRSAWGVLAPSGLSSEKQAIALTGRALSEDLVEIFSEAPSGGDRAAITDLDARLDELEREMREITQKLPVAQLRSTLPEQVSVDRRGVLDLLDLVLGAEIAGLHGTRERIPVLDYLITLLCTGGEPDAPLQDPVTLTPRLHGLCERSGVEYDPRLPELEAEFFAAADLHEADVRAEVELRTLRHRKMELGPAFFAPRVLRAIVTYNAALLRSIDEQVLSSQDWGAVPSVETTESDAVSVFESAALPKLAEALRRRVAGDPPAHDPVDRIAWCLDLAYLTRAERDALLSESTGRREELMGTMVLAGLLRRSAVVLDEEFPAIGVAPSQLSGAWLQELDGALQQEVNRRIAGDDYAGACVLTELKSRFLTGAKIDARKGRVGRSAPAPIRDHASGQARQIANEALEHMSVEQASHRLRDLPWGRIARAGAAALLALCVLTLLDRVFFDEARVPRSELEQVSPFLASGKRSDEGAGRAFVGSLADEWSALDSEEQSEAAVALAKALRGRGIHEIMIYDEDHQLRIQALGNQPPRVIPPHAPPDGSPTSSQ